MIRLILPLFLLSLLAACSPERASCTNFITGKTYHGYRFSYGIQLEDENGFLFMVDHSNGAEWECRNTP